MLLGDDGILQAGTVSLAFPQAPSETSGKSLCESLSAI